MSQTVAEVLRAAAETLKDAGIEGAAREARILLAHAMGTRTDRLTLMMRDAVGAEAIAKLDTLARRRAAREPLSHLTGLRHFWRHEFKVSPSVLDPRPETEMVVLAALQASFTRVLDLGTGSGAILLSLLAESEADGVGTDISPEALEVARANGAKIGVERVSFVASDWFSDVEGRFDLIVSNPPYIAEDEMAGLAPELAHEPRLALTDGADGLSAYRAITAGARDHLEPGGRLIVEIGPTQARSVADLFRAAGFAQVEVRQDLDGRDRIVLGHRPL